MSKSWTLLRQFLTSGLSATGRQPWLRRYGFATSESFRWLRYGGRSTLWPSVLIAGDQTPEASGMLSANTQQFLK